MKILAYLLFCLFIIIPEGHTQADSLEFIETLEIDEIESIYEPIQMCSEASMAVWKTCLNDSVGDLNKCTEHSIKQFIENNAKMPQMASCFQGRVFISFVIDQDGDVGDIEVLKGIHKEIDTEAIRVINLMPSFYPATQRNRPVEMKYTVPITFSSF
ncbi:MAG: energy transducer TonB [Flavobacteriales bacterium]